MAWLTSLRTGRIDRVAGRTSLRTYRAWLPVRLIVSDDRRTAFLLHPTAFIDPPTCVFDPPTDFIDSPTGSLRHRAWSPLHRSSFRLPTHDRVVHRAVFILPPSSSIDLRTVATRETTSSFRPSHAT
jgi:hypothetical protein